MQTAPSFLSAALVARVHLVAALLGLACASCAPENRAATTVSVETLEQLAMLRGRSLHIDGVGPADGDVYVSDVYVGPNPVTGHGAVVLLASEEALYKRPSPNAPQGAEGVWYLPVVTEGDAAHLLAVAGTRPPAKVAGVLSGAYCRTAGIE